MNKDPLLETVKEMILDLHQWQSMNSHQLVVKMDNQLTILVENAQLREENERLKSMLTEARKNVDLCLLYHEAMYADEPEIMKRKTTADRDLRDRINAALAAKDDDEFCRWEYGFTSCRGSYLYRVKGPCPNCGKPLLPIGG